MRSYSIILAAFLLLAQIASASSYYYSYSYYYGYADRNYGGRGTHTVTYSGMALGEMIGVDG